MPHSISVMFDVLKRRRLCFNVICRSCQTVVTLGLQALGRSKWYQLYYNVAVLFCLFVYVVCLYVFVFLFVMCVVGVVEGWFGWDMKYKKIICWYEWKERISKHRISMLLNLLCLGQNNLLSVANANILNDKAQQTCL